MGEVLGNVKCGCGCDAVPIKEGKGGCLTGHCPVCGTQIMNRTPAGVTKWRAAFSAGRTPTAAPTAPGAPSAGDSGIDLLKI